MSPSTFHKMRAVQSPTRKPVPKVAAAGTTGAATTALVAIAQALGVDLPPEAAAGLVALAAFAAGYLR